VVHDVEDDRVMTVYGYDKDQYYPLEKHSPINP